MAELDIVKVDDKNDPIKLNGVPSDANLGFENENESRENDAQGSCVTQKRTRSNETNHADQSHDSSIAISDKATNALANGHLKMDQATSERSSVLDDRHVEQTDQTPQDHTSSTFIDGKESHTNDKDKKTISNGEETNSSVVDEPHKEESSAADDTREVLSIRTSMSADVTLCGNLVPSEIPRMNSGLSITMVSTPRSSEQRISGWDRTNDERKTDCESSDSNDHHPSEEGNKDVETISICSTPEKLSKKYNKKSLPSANITPRRSSRNLNKQRNYNDRESDSFEDGSPDGGHVKKLTDDDDIEEVTPMDPLADDSRSKMRNKTIVVSDTKGLVEFATNARISSKCNRKEPTLVIIDTKSILSGRGPVPVSQSSGGTSLLHSAVGSAPIPVSLPISASSLNHNPRGLSVSSSAFSVIPIGLSTQGLYSHYKSPPAMKPIVVGPASTTVTPISIQGSGTSASSNMGSLTPSVAAINVSSPAKQPSAVLPSLTDDMFVVEAPSFIVPYVYEKPPMKALKEYIGQIKTEIEAAEEKEAEEKQKLEAEEKQKLEAEEKLKLEAEEKEKLEAEEKEKLEAEEKVRLEAEVAESAEKETMDEEKENEKKENDTEEKEKDVALPMETDSAVVDEANEANKLKDVDPSKSEEDNVKKDVSDTGDVEMVTEKSEVTRDDQSLVEVSSVESSRVTEVASDSGKSDSNVADKKEDVEKKDAPETPTAVTAKDDTKKSTSAVDDSKKPLSFFDNPLGKFFIQIGLNLVQEHVQTDLLRSQKRKRDKEGDNCSAEVHATISELTRTLESSKENNDPFKLDTKKCELCSFRTESLLVMAHHLETPHMKNYTYRCNFCPLEVRSPHDILFHMEAEHNVRGRLERAPAFHQCANCPFEDNQKGKLTRHMVSCSKKYRPEKNQESPLDWEPPAKIPRVTRNRPPSMSPGNAVYQAAMSGLKQVPQNSLLPKLMPNSTNMKSNLMGPNKRPNSVSTGFVGRFPNANTTSNFQQRSISIQNSNPGLMFRTPLTNSQTQVLLPQNYSLPVSNATLYQSSGVKQPQQGMAAAKLLNQPSISITPLPRQSSISQQASSASNAVMNSTGKSTKSTATVVATSAGSNNKNSFVVCEICDGYIKDLEQLRNHMQWIHKVKIHPKMIYNRPPLNCQKCQFRFFTDQGLERHLLGSHGLVTSSMQEAANKGKDGGRCPVCGRVYQWKLLNHVARDHQMALKPAHLSYKCTVCTATFGMYKQFESHVYSAHSVVAKRAMDPKKPSGIPSASSQNEALLKPLKINDEITIIPQPVRSSKPMNKMMSNAQSVVNARSKDGCDEKLCGRICVSEDFPTIEEFKRHVLSEHVKKFRIKLSRIDGNSFTRNTNETNKLEADTPHCQPSITYTPVEVALRAKHSTLKSFQIRLTNLIVLRDDCVYKVRTRGEDDDSIKYLIPQIDLRIEEPETIEIQVPTVQRAPMSRKLNKVVSTSATPSESRLQEETAANFSTFGNHFLSGRHRPTSNDTLKTSRGVSKVLKPRRINGSCRSGSSASRGISFSSTYATGASKVRLVLASPIAAVDSKSLPVRTNKKKTFAKLVRSSSSLSHLVAAPSTSPLTQMQAGIGGVRSLQTVGLVSQKSAISFAVQTSRKSSATSASVLQKQAPNDDVIVLSSDSDDDSVSHENDDRTTNVVQSPHESASSDEYILPV